MYNTHKAKNVGNEMPTNRHSSLKRIHKFMINDQSTVYYLSFHIIFRHSSYLVLLLLEKKVYMYNIICDWIEISLKNYQLLLEYRISPDTEQRNVQKRIKLWTNQFHGIFTYQSINLSYLYDKWILWTMNTIFTNQTKFYNLNCTKVGCWLLLLNSYFH